MTNTKFKTPNKNQIETTMRDAFRKALNNTKEHTKQSGVIFRALCSYAGIVGSK